MVLLLIWFAIITVHVSSAQTKQSNVIALDPGVRRINKKSVRQMLTWAHYRFKCSLKSMAALRNVILIDVNEAYTSKTSTVCGTVHRKLGGSKIFKCSHCGSFHYRDWNGARNIMLRALQGAAFILKDNVIEVFPEIAEFLETIA